MATADETHGSQQLQYKSACPVKEHTCVTARLGDRG